MYDPDVPSLSTRGRPEPQLPDVSETHTTLPQHDKHRAGMLTTLKQAIAGADLDYTKEPIGRAVVLLAIPMVLEMLMESVFAVADVFFVSRLGVDAVAAVGLTEAVVTLIYAIAGGLAMATSAMVARRIGEGRPRAAAVAAVQAIVVGVFATVCIAVPGAVFAPHILTLMGGTPELVAGGAGYTAVLLGGSGTIMMLFLINASFRGAGDASTAMRTLWLANGINIVLDPCLIFGLGPFPELGLTGAAIATTTGRGIGVMYQLWVLIRGSERLKVTREVIRLELEVVMRLLRVSVGGILQFLIATSSWVGLVRIIGEFGSSAVAGYTIAIRIIIVAILPSWGVANAAATLMGQNLGAGRPDRAARSVWVAAGCNVLFLLAVAVTFITAAQPLVRIFTSDPAVIAYGVACLRFVSYGYPMYALGMVMVQAFNGAGDTMTPTVINFFCYWLFQIPLAYVLAHSTGLEVTGVFLAITVAESVIAVVGMLVFRRGRWKERTI
jgi:putative MATE family efflux protein